MLSDRILFIDGEALVLDKPAGLPVDQPRRGASTGKPAGLSSTSASPSIKRIRSESMRSAMNETLAKRKLSAALTRTKASL